MAVVKSNVHPLPCSYLSKDSSYLVVNIMYKCTEKYDLYEAMFYGLAKLIFNVLNCLFLEQVCDSILEQSIDIRQVYY